MAASRQNSHGSIDRWHSQLVGWIRQLTRPEALSLLNRLEATFNELRAAVDELEKRGPAAANRPEIAGTRRSEGSPSNDLSRVRTRLSDSWALVDGLRQLWPNLDLVDEEVRNAVAPWDDACRLCIAVRSLAAGAIAQNQPGSEARTSAVLTLKGRIEGELCADWRLAIQRAITRDLKLQLDRAFRDLHETACGIVELASSTPMRGDVRWAAALGRFDHTAAVLAALRPAILAAIEKLRADAGHALNAAIDRLEPHRDDGVRSRIDRLARDAVRRAHQGYIDDEVFAAAVACGLSYRKAAQQLSSRFGRTVTKRQVEEAVKRSGGLDRVRQESRRFATMDDL